MCKIRLLRADEIDLRAKQVSENRVMLLLYKDARCDMAILDETFGCLNWKRRHEFKDGNNYCTVSIWDEDKKEWIDKEDVGVESMTEKEKGQASDAFKRACTNVGIGRELYTAPSIWISLKPNEVTNKGGRYYLSRVNFHVSNIEYDEKRSIKTLVISDNSNVVRFEHGVKSKPKEFKPGWLENKEAMQSIFNKLDNNPDNITVFLKENFTISDMMIEKVTEQYNLYKSQANG